jgi:hypothetical protein
VLLALLALAPVESRAVVAGFDGGAITSNAGVLLFGATGRTIGLVRRARRSGKTRSPHASRRSGSPIAAVPIDPALILLT